VGSGIGLVLDVIDGIINLILDLIGAIFHLIDRIFTLGFDRVDGVVYIIVVVISAAGRKGSAETDNAQAKQRCPQERSARLLRRFPWH
jgi:hypothetical protein